MRYIDISKIQLPAGWKTKADNLTAKIKAEPDAAKRAKIMDDNPIWKELLVPLSQLSKGKCWYSEAQDVMSDRDVDHFRPKNEAKNVDNIPRGDEEGYWWLAYDYENYRFSSKYSNRKTKDKFRKKKFIGGKGTLFPLFAGSPVAKTKNRCRDEQIMLLDPCDQNDPGLLTFDSKGIAMPDVSAILDPDDRIRVEVSIKIYNLDYSTLEELRERIWGICQRMIDEIRNITNDPDGMSNVGKDRVKFLKDEIRKMTDRNAVVSAVAIACCEQNGLKVLTQGI
ncbi:MAG: hypothetical protein IT216_13325 [Saprospiraceae bacterium]|nr:hypothetical protein [Saprospiraceae bacterium]